MKAITVQTKPRREVYRVLSDIRNAPTQNYHFYGYETENDFYQALCRLIARWHDRIGEAVEERNGFRRIMFHDTPGGKADEVWLPRYLLEQAEDPGYSQEHGILDETEPALNEAFGFD